MKTPDLYVLLDITIAKNDKGIPPETITKLFSTWHGGYLGSDEWRLNSGITEVRTHNKHYQILGNSSTIYEVGDNIGTSSWTQGILTDILKSSPDFVSTKVIDNPTQVIKKLKSLIK
jgi:hypothetical protein